jgi:CheY-like chemotaxis protein
MTTFLLADDDIDDAEIFEEALRAVDPTIKFYRAENGADVFVRLESMIPDLIFLDLNMPEMSGWQCLAKLKNTTGYDQIPVIMYTTSSNPRDKEIATDLKAHGLITKPSQPRLLENILLILIKGLKDGRLEEVLKDAYVISRE